MNKFQKMRESLLNLNNLPIYIAGHIKPDQDSVCSCLALALWFKQNNKNAKVLLKKGDENIINWQGESKFIEFEITDKEYNFIALDLNEMKRLGEFYVGFQNAKKSINIDHHQGNLFEADETLSIEGISSTCEIIYEIIKKDLNKTICELLYCGMMNDTNCFSRRLSKNTLSIAQKLINYGIDYLDIIKQTFSNRTLYLYKALAKVVNEMQFDDFYYSVIDKSLPEFCELSHNQIVKQIAEDLRKIEGIDIYIVLIKDNEKIIGKVMTNISSNADKIASVVGGGGHKKEAGFTIENMSINQILDNIKSYLKNKC